MRGSEQRERERVQERERSLILKCVFIMETKEFTREQLDVLAGLVCWIGYIGTDMQTIRL